MPGNNSPEIVRQGVYEAMAVAICADAWDEYRFDRIGYGKFSARARFVSVG